MNRLSYLIVRTTPVQGFLGWAKRRRMPGGDGLSLYTVGRHFFTELRTNKVNTLAAAVTYNFLMALAPSLLFLFSLIPYLPLKMDDSIQAILKVATPNTDTYNKAWGVVNDFMHHEHRNVLSFGILLTLFFSSNGLMGLMRTFDRSLSLYKKRSILRRRWTAIKLTVMLLCIVISTLSVLVFFVQNHQIKKLLPGAVKGLAALSYVTPPALVLFIFIAISTVYTYGPSLTHRFKFVSTGSVFATTLCVLLTVVFFFMVRNVLHYSKVYGPIGSIIGMMVWLYTNTQILILGFELNVSILLGKLERDKNVKPATPVAAGQPLKLV